MFKISTRGRLWAISYSHSHRSNLKNQGDPTRHNVHSVLPLQAMEMRQLPPYLRVTDPQLFQNHHDRHTEYLDAPILDLHREA